jgi:hypothetical protein
VARATWPRSEQRSDALPLRASFHEGRGPSLKGGLRPVTPSDATHGPLRREVNCLGGLVLCRGGGRGACGAVCAQTTVTREQDAGTSRDPSGSLTGYRSTQLVGSDTALQVYRQGRSEACRDCPLHREG